MKFHHGFRTILTAGLATALLAGAALAAPVTAVPIHAVPNTETAQPVRVYGSATSITEVKNGSRIRLENSNDKDPNQKIDLLISDKTMILDAVTGESKTMKDIAEGETLYAYVGPAMAQSLPPQAGATLLLCNIPADFAVPKFARVQTVTLKEDGAVDVLMAPSVILHLNQDTLLLPYPAERTVQLDDITVGTHLLSWYTAETRSMPGQAVPTKVMVFPKAADPAATITRGDFMELLYTSAKRPAVAASAPFADVNTPAVSWAVAQKITTGTGETTFCPDDALTREQLMTFLLRYATALEKGPVGAWAVRMTYADSAQIGPWAASGAMWNEITKLVAAAEGNLICPSAPVTHGEAAAAVAGLLAR